MHGGLLEHSRLGSSGIEVSCVGLGANNFGRRLDLEQTRRAVDAALETGVNFIDTANVYGGGPASLPRTGPGNPGDSERFLGELLAGRRERVVLATKFGNDMGDGVVARGARSQVRRALEASLARLRTDYVDLLYYHRPDGITPLEETIGAMEELAHEGKVRALGASNLTAVQLRQIGRRISVLENHYNLLETGDATEVIPTCLELDIAYIPYFPLASGLLTGKYRRDRPASAGTRLENRQIEGDDYDRIETLDRFAHRHQHTLLELAIAWLLSHAAIPSVIAGATTPEQVRANTTAAQWHLTPDELDALREIRDRARSGSPEADESRSRE